jgi:hypothetical protein
VAAVNTRTRPAVYIRVSGGKVHRADCPSVAQATPERRNEVTRYRGLDRAGIARLHNTRRRVNGLGPLPDAQVTTDCHGCVR